jgi:hypothetical protein
MFPLDQSKQMSHMALCRRPVSAHASPIYIQAYSNVHVHLLAVDTSPITSLPACSVYVACRFRLGEGKRGAHKQISEPFVPFVSQLSHSIYQVYRKQVAQLASVRYYINYTNIYGWLCI